MKPSNSIQQSPGARASGFGGGAESPQRMPNNNSRPPASWHGLPWRWRWRVLAKAAVVTVAGLCSLVARADVVYEPLLRFGDPQKFFSSAAFTPDGKQLLSTLREVLVDPVTSEYSFQFRIVLWDVQAGSQVREFDSGKVDEWHQVPVAVSLDGCWGLTGSQTNDARLWDLRTGERIQSFVGHTNSITAVAFPPDGQRVLTGSADGTSVLWEARSGQAVRTFVPADAYSWPESVVQFVGFSRDGNRVAALRQWDAGGHTLRIWDIQTGQLVRTIEDAANPQLWRSLDLAPGPVGPWFILSPDGRLALRRNYNRAGDEGWACLIDAATGRELRWFAVFPSGPVVFAPNASRVVAGSSLWDIGDLVDWLAGGRLNQPDVVTKPLVTIGQGLLHELVVAPDGSYFVSAGNRGVLFWDPQTGVVTRRLAGKEGVVYSIDLSPDAMLLLTTGGADPSETKATIWDAATGQPLRTFASSSRINLRARFSGSGAEVVTVAGSVNPTDYWSTILTISVWDAGTGNLLRTIATTKVEETKLGVVLAPDGSRVILGTAQNTAKIYDVSTGQVIWTFTDPPADKIDGVAFSPDGCLLILTVWREEGRLRARSAELWDLASRQWVRTLWAHTNEYWLVGGPVAFSPDSRRALIVDGPTAEIREIPTGGLVSSWGVPNRHFGYAAFTQDGRQVLAAQDANDVWLVDVETGQRLRAYPPGPRRPLVFAPEGRRVLTGSADGAAQLRDAWTSTLLRTFEGSAEPFVFSPDGRQVLTGSADWTARLYDAETGERLANFPGQTNDLHWADGATSVALSPNRRRALTLKGHSAELWDVETGLLMDRFPEVGPASSAFFSTDGTKVLALGLSPEEAAGVWDAYSGSLVNLFPCDFRWALVFSPDGQRVLIGVEGDEMKLCDAGTGEVLRTLSPVSPEWGGMGYQPIRFSPDGTLASIGATLWDLRSGKRLRRLASWPEQTILCSAFSPHGREILTASEDGSVCLWDAATGQLLRTFVGCEYRGTDAVSFSPDGVVVAIGTWDGVVDIWDLRDRLAGLRTSVVGGKLEMRWELGTLQSAEAVNGPWQDVTNAVSPFAVDLSAGARFYRVKVEE